MKTLSIALKDLQVLVKDRGLLFQLFLLPLIFIFVLSGALGSMGKTESVELPKLAVVDQDKAEVASILVNNLSQEGSLTVNLASAVEAASLLKENKVVGVMTIPEGFTSGIEEGALVNLVLTTAPKANPQEVEAVRLVIASMIADLSLENQIIASLKQLGEMRGSLPEENQVFATERVLAQARQQFVSAQARPLIQIAQTSLQLDSTEENTPDVGQAAVPGFTVLFVFLAAQSTARSIYEEKKIGSFRRLVAAPLSKVELLIGKLLPNFITNLAQIVVIFTLGNFGMTLLGMAPLPVDKSPLGTILISVVLALCSSAFGIAIAGVARTENQISGVSTLLLWGMALVGGSLVPLFLLERFMGKIPMIVPHYWANRAFDDLLIRRLGMAEVGLDLLVLLGFSLVFFVIGLWRFDFEH
jgi:ABC-2 type transport system permease protein